MENQDLTAEPVIEVNNEINNTQEEVVIERDDSIPPVIIEEGIESEEEKEGIVKTEEGEKTLDDFIREEFSKSNSNIGDLNIQKFFSDIESKATEEEKHSDTYKRLQRVKDRFMSVVNFNFVHKYRYNIFSIPVKYKNRKERESYINQYPEMAFKKLERNRKHAFVSPTKAYSHFKAAFTKEEQVAARNFFLVFCHFIVHKDVNVNAYAIMYVLNRMLRFDENYAKEEFAFRQDIKATVSEELNCHAIKQLILEHYSGRIAKWKKVKSSPNF